MKSEIEEYLCLKQESGKLLNCCYTRIKYLDEDTDKFLMLFLRKGKVFGRMQLWNLCGICEWDDWTEDAEDDGLIKFWIDSKIEDFKSMSDWVWDLRVWLENQERLRRLDEKEERERIKIGL